MTDVIKYPAFPTFNSQEDYPYYVLKMSIMDLIQNLMFPAYDSQHMLLVNFYNHIMKGSYLLKPSPTNVGEKI